MIKIEKFSVYLANLNSQIGTESGKTRPVVVVQTDLLNDVHPSTIICPVTTQVHARASILRVHLKKGESGLDLDSDILIDQLRSIDNRRFIKFIGKLSSKHQKAVLENLKIIILEDL